MTHVHAPPLSTAACRQKCRCWIYIATIKTSPPPQSGRNILASRHSQTSLTTAWSEKYHEEVTISNPPSSQQLPARLSDRTGSFSKTACMSMHASRRSGANALDLLVVSLSSSSLAVAGCAGRGHVRRRRQQQQQQQHQDT